LVAWSVARAARREEGKWWMVDGGWWMVGRSAARRVVEGRKDNIRARRRTTAVVGQSRRDGMFIETGPNKFLPQPQRGGMARPEDFPISHAAPMGLEMILGVWFAINMSSLRNSD
jgi:hypothetical protein